MILYLVVLAFMALGAAALQAVVFDDDEPDEEDGPEQLRR